MGGVVNYSAASRAKLNLFLHVTGKRADGYHNIYTLFCGIDFSDIITISPSKSRFLETTGIKIPIGEDNIIIKVDNILRTGYGLKENYKITVNKRIPVGAGLGGGSSNACTYLQLVNEAAGLGLSFEEKHNILAQVGSDAPFFLYLPAAIGSGRGDLLTPFNIKKKLHFLLINPGIFVSTASVYNDAKLRLTTKEDLPKILNLDNVEEVAALMSNDLQAAVFAGYPVLPQLCADLEKAGAIKAIMSGSGSTVFGIFHDERSRDTAYSELSREHSKFNIIKADSFEGNI